MENGYLLELIDQCRDSHGFNYVSTPFWISQTSNKLIDYVLSTILVPIRNLTTPHITYPNINTTPYVIINLTNSHT